jgi:threonine/homoserine/homoserine lactone efflux protein
MREKIKNFFLSLLSQDMAQQAREVEILTLVIFALLLIVVGFLWQYQIELTRLQEGKRIPVGKMNVFELLLSKGR